MTQKKTRKTQSQTKQQASGASASASEREVEVLYQRIGSRWFAFSVIDDEVYMGSISEDTVSPDQRRPFLNEIK